MYSDCNSRRLFSLIDYAITVCATFRVDQSSFDSSFFVYLFLWLVIIIEQSRQDATAIRRCFGTYQLAGQEKLLRLGPLWFPGTKLFTNIKIGDSHYNSFGFLQFAIGWWMIFDVAACYPSMDEFHHAYHVCGLFDKSLFYHIFYANHKFYFSITPFMYCRCCWNHIHDHVSFFRL